MATGGESIGPGWLYPIYVQYISTMYKGNPTMGLYFPPSWFVVTCTQYTWAMAWLTNQFPFIQVHPSLCLSFCWAYSLYYPSSGQQSFQRATIFPEGNNLSSGQQSFQWATIFPEVNNLSSGQQSFQWATIFPVSSNLSSEQQSVQ